MKTDATAPEDSARRVRATKVPQAGLSIVWSADGAHLGEVLLPVAGLTMIFGRGGPRAGDEAPRLLPVRQVPGETSPTTPVANEKLSRSQISVRSAGETLTIENLGKLPLFHRGRAVDACVAKTGDVVRLGHQLTFLVVTRPAVLQGDGGGAPHTFGEADAFGIVGESPATWAVRDAIRFIGPRSPHALVLGPTGTGKELVARAIHAQSARASKPLVSRNAATLPEGLIDAELFGNARGYPNATMAERQGLIGAAHGSSLFLDEFAELAPDAQAHLLRVLDEGEYQRLGESQLRRSDFRLIAATNRPMSALKRDVAARLPLRVTTPALADRREDIPLLVRHMLRSMARDDQAVARFVDGHGHARVSADWMESLLARSYPANVRELRGLVWDAVARSSGKELGDGVEPPPESVRMHVEVPMEPTGEAGLTKERVAAALAQHNGNLEETWRALGLANRYVLRRLLEKHQIPVTRKKG